MQRAAVVVLVGLIAAVALHGAPAAGAVQSMRFEQFVYQDVFTLDTTPPTDLGDCVVDFSAEPTAFYLNVAAFVPGLSTEPQWVVHNLRLHAVGEGVPETSIGCQFPLSLLGVEPGVPLVSLLYGWTVQPETLLDADAPAWLATVSVSQPAPVVKAKVSVGNGAPAVPVERTGLLPDRSFVPATTAGADTIKSNIGCEMPNVDLNGATRPQDVNACAPASCGNSLEWLKKKHPGAIAFPGDSRSVMQQIEGLAGRTGTNGVWPKDLAKAKLDFIEAHRLPIHVKLQDISSENNIASTSGRSNATDSDGGATQWPTRNYILEEARKGEDVEVIMTWYYRDTDGKLKPSNFAHAVVLTGAGTRGGADFVRTKDDSLQHAAGGLRERQSDLESKDNMVQLPGYNITIPSGPGAGRTGIACVSAVISESRDDNVPQPPASEGFSGYCQLIKRAVPKGGTISFDYPDTGTNRCFNSTLIVRDPGRPGRDVSAGPWNFNQGKTRSWTNSADHPVVVMLHNDDKAHGQAPYPAWQVGIAVSNPPGAKARLESDLFNPHEYGGFSLGGNDSSSAEFSWTDLGPSVIAGPIGLGFDLGGIPSRLAAATGGTQDLRLLAEIPAWNPYWGELGLVVDVLSVVQPGDLLVDCPTNGFSSIVQVTGPGRYELVLGTVPVSPNFELHLSVAAGLDMTLDAIGVPSLVVLSLTDAPPSAKGLHLAAAAPNPFNPLATIRFDLPRAMHVALAVHDQRGRLVRTLVDAELPEGERSVQWDGKDGRGRTVASGVYVVRLVTELGTKTSKVTLAK